MSILRQTCLAVAIAIFSTAAFTQTLTQTNDEKAAVAAVLQNFISAYVTGDADTLRKAFRSDGIMVGYSPRSKAVVTRNGIEFAKGFDGKPAADEAQRKRSFEILDITHHGALAKVIMDYPGWYGIDYLSLAKIDGQWIIISKTWHGQVKPMPVPAPVPAS
jgi:hypothetical protein